jgi:hypothetical protein
MIRLYRFLISASIFFIGPLQALEFSASAVMSTPGRTDVSTQLYYSDGRLRKEFFYYGEPVIQILDANHQLSLMCFTDQQLCYENQSLEKITIGIESAIESPCDDTVNLTCEKLGEETLNQRTVIKWKVTNSKNDDRQVSYLWLDAELKIPVKQTLANGATVDLIWQASEILNNRQTEKWKQRIELPNGEIQESIQWYDKELKISIRQTFPSGNTQEMTHIVVENLPDKLFTIPKGYAKRITANQSAQSRNSPE